MVNRRINALSLIITIVLMARAHSQDSLPQSFPLDKGYNEVNRFCRDTLDRPTNRLLLSEDDSVALMAAWSQVKQKVLSDKREEVEPIGDRADRFLGFVEGRLQIDLPTWWEDQLRAGSVYETAGYFRELSATWSFSSDERRFTGVDDVSSDLQNVVLKQGRQSVRLKRSLFRDLAAEVEGQTAIARYRIAAAIEERRAYVCVCGYFSPRGLYCVDRETGEVVWDSPVHDGWPNLAGSGLWLGGYSEVITTNDSVIVLGAHDLAMYLQVFSKKDGSTKVRFATSYLDQRGG